MNLFDLLVVTLALAAALGGYRVGFVARVASWIGLAAGLLVAARVAPPLLSGLEAGEPQLRLVVAVVTFLLIASLGATAGEFAGAKLRRLLPIGPLRMVDRAAGAAAAGLGVFVVLWLLLPTLAEVPGEISRQVRSSAVAQAVDRLSPRAPDSLRALRDLVRDADFPEVFDRLQAAPDTGPPPPSGVLPADVEARVLASTVQVTGQACSRILEGSGFTAAPGMVVTNAHVVAGVDRPRVVLPSGDTLAGQVVAFDGDRDLALIRVDGLPQEPLPLGSGEVGTEGAVFGHPRGQAQVEVSPARVTAERTARGWNIYHDRFVDRRIFFLAAELEPGDSGGALVDTSGAVIGVAFAVAPDDPAVAYALTVEEVEEILASPRAGAVDTGPCLR